MGSQGRLPQGVKGEVNLNQGRKVYTRLRECGMLGEMSSHSFNWTHSRGEMERAERMPRWGPVDQARAKHLPGGTSRLQASHASVWTSQPGHLSNNVSLIFSFPRLKCVSISSVKYKHLWNKWQLFSPFAADWWTMLLSPSIIHDDNEEEVRENTREIAILAPHMP